MTKPLPKVRRVPITDIKFDPANANEGTQRGDYMIEESLQDTGPLRSVGLDKDMTLIVGNKTTAKAGELGFESVIVIESDGTELIAVQRTDLDLTDQNGKARRAAYWDNQAGVTSMQWNPEQVFKDMEAGFDFSAMFRDEELDDLVLTVRGAPTLAEMEEEYGSHNPTDLDPYIRVQVTAETKALYERMMEVLTGEDKFNQLLLMVAPLLISPETSTLYRRMMEKLTGEDKFHQLLTAAVPSILGEAST